MSVLDLGSVTPAAPTRPHPVVLTVSQHLCMNACSHISVLVYQNICTLHPALLICFVHVCDDLHQFGAGHDLAIVGRVFD